MKFELFTRVALKEDLPNHKLCRSYVVTIVEHGYSLEVFNSDLAPFPKS